MDLAGPKIRMFLHQKIEVIKEKKGIPIQQGEHLILSKQKGKTKKSKFKNGQQISMAVIGLRYHK